MKNKILLFSCLLLASLVLVSCNKDENQLTAEDLAENRVGPLPDLTIPVYTTNLPAPLTTTLCGPELPNISCAGGNRGFMATIPIVNQGPGDLAAGGSITVRWFDLNNPLQFQDQIIPNPGIPAGTSIRVTRGYSFGPCDCAPPFTSFTHTFLAFVDPTNAIQEVSEGNNRSPQYATCDGC